MASPNTTNKLTSTCLIRSCLTCPLALFVYLDEIEIFSSSRRLRRTIKAAAVYHLFINKPSRTPLNCVSHKTQFLTMTMWRWGKKYLRNSCCCHEFSGLILSASNVWMECFNIFMTDKVGWGARSWHLSSENYCKVTRNWLWTSNLADRVTIDQSWHHRDIAPDNLNKVPLMKLLFSPCEN